MAFPLSAAVIDSPRSSRGEDDDNEGSNIRRASDKSSAFVLASLKHENEKLRKDMEALRDQLASTRSMNFNQALKDQVEVLKPPQSIDEVVRQLRRGHWDAINCVRSVEAKFELLDVIEEEGDGELILAALIHIHRTTPRMIFDALERHPRCMRVFERYLINSGKIVAAHEMYINTKQLSNAAYVSLRMAFTSQNLMQRKDLLLSTAAGMESIGMEAEGKHVRDAADLLSRQMQIESHDSNAAQSKRERIYMIHPRWNVLCRPVRDTLLYCLFYHPNAPKEKLSSPKGIQERYGINERTYLYVALHARAAVGDWASVQQLAIQKGVFTDSEESCIGFEPFADAVWIFRGPLQLLRHFISKIDKLPLRARVATQYQQFDMAVDALAACRDLSEMHTLRDALLSLGTPVAGQFVERVEQMIAQRKSR